MNIVLETGQSCYEDITVFKEIKSVDVTLNKERYNVCTITKDGNRNSEMLFNEQVFNVLEQAKKINYVFYYTLIAFVDRIIKLHLMMEELFLHYCRLLQMCATITCRRRVEGYKDWLI